MTKDNRILTGRKQITAYVGRSWAIVKKWIAQEGFPAVLVDGVWTSYVDLVDEFVKAKVKKAPD